MVSTEGGDAHRLTTHLAQEEWPVFSPDGKHIAFVANYDGSADVYVISIRGGRPERIFWDGGRPVGWTPDGKVLIRTYAYAGLPNAQLVIVDPVTRELERVPLDQAAEGGYTEDGTLFFARLPRQGSNCRWYKGGTAQKLWKFRKGMREAVPLTTDYPGTSRQPTVMQDGRVYFLSDREDAMNIWSMDQDGGDLKRHTSLTNWDIQELAGQGTMLAYRIGAEIWTLDIQSGLSTKVDIHLVTDREQALIDWESYPYVEQSAISNDGKRVAFVARGELFAAPVGTGRLVHVSRNSGVRYRNVLFSSDNKELFALSDRSGELEWWRAQSDGLGPPEQITTGPQMLKNGGKLSSDGKYLVHSSYNKDLWLVDLESGDTKLMAEATSHEGAWSPDSRFYVYSQHMPSLMDALFVYDLEEDTHTQITSDRFNDHSPAISKDGDWLFFVSSRTWNSSVSSPWGERAPLPHFEDREKIYAIPLRDEVTFPFALANELRPPKEEEKKTEDKKEEDEQEENNTEENNTEEDTKEAVSEKKASTNEDNKDEDKSKDQEEEKKPVRWDLKHLMRELPIPAGDYWQLSVNKNRLFYRSEGDLMAIELKAEVEPVRVVEKASGYMLSGDGKKMLIRKGNKLYVVPAKGDKDVKLEGKNEVLFSGLRFGVNKQEEWKQIYYDAWRMHRDYFWDPGMHGVDWEHMRDKYASLLPRVGAREELADLQGLLISELSLLHSNAYGGANRRTRVSVGTAYLGGFFERDEATRGFRLIRRYEADPDLPHLWSPLADPEVCIEPGSIILSVNGQPAGTAFQLGELLMDQAGKQVRIQVQDPEGEQREVIVQPISRGKEASLRYHEWEYSRRKKVDDISDGAIGYVHLRAMSRPDIGQWTREFYSQTHKQGMIVDVRHNNGGNIDSWVLTQLLRKAWAYFKSRTGFPTTNMQYSFSGHLIVLVDELTASDGESLAEGFRRLKLGKTIGMRTWGGYIWLTSSNRQVDGGIARAAEIGVYGPDGDWMIEGWGHEPNKEVDNLPHQTFNGRDAQLEAAVKQLQRLIKKDPRHIPDPPPYPILVPGSGFPTPWHQQDTPPARKTTRKTGKKAATRSKK